MTHQNRIVIVAGAGGSYAAFDGELSDDLHGPQSPLTDDLIDLVLEEVAGHLPAESVEQRLGRTMPLVG